MNNKDIKPCPFCGYKDIKSVADGAILFCPKCRTTQTKELWNNRPETDTLREENELLRNGATVLPNDTICVTAGHHREVKNMLTAQVEGWRSLAKNLGRKYNALKTSLQNRGAK